MQPFPRTASCRLRAFALAGAFAFGALGVTFARPALASLVVAMDVDELTRRADRIVVGEILSVESAWDERHERIVSTIDVAVADVWKGSMPDGGRLRIVQPGGTVGDVEMRVHGLPFFAAGERAVLFLRSDKPLGTTVRHALVGLGQGRRLLRAEPTTGRWLADPPDQSAAVSIDKGMFRPAPPEPAVPVEQLREHVRQRVRALTGGTGLERAR
jgi:hypothetical protein